MNSLAERKKELDKILDSWDRILDENEIIVKKLKEAAKR